jgi:branched-chain amino acid transport system ATP-binding protein
MLEVRGLTKAFRGLVAVKDVSFRVAPREIVALIGPNGAGKTTCFNLIAGALVPTSGTVMLDGKPLTALAPEQIAVRGLIRMRGMTVLENVMMGAFARTSDVSAATDIAGAAIARVDLGSKSGALAGSLTLPDRAWPAPWPRMKPSSVPISVCRFGSSSSRDPTIQAARWVSHSPRRRA